MNTHDKYELPPLPEASIVSYQTDSTMRSMELRTHSDEDMRDYARAAIVADRKRRGDPVATRFRENKPYAGTDNGWQYVKQFQPDEIWTREAQQEYEAQQLYLAPQPAEPVKVPSDPAVAAIQFALEADESLPFLHCWNEGNFDAIRKEWPEAPDSVFIGADPTHPETRALLERYGQK